MAEYLDFAAPARLAEAGRHLSGATDPWFPSGPEKIAGYIAHRLEREERVLAALRARGPATPAALVPDSYPDVKPELYPPGRAQPASRTSASSCAKAGARPRRIGALTPSA